jgi:hypothetical protein
MHYDDFESKPESVAAALYPSSSGPAGWPVALTIGTGSPGGVWPREGKFGRLLVELIHAGSRPRGHVFVAVKVRMWHQAQLPGYTGHFRD